MAVPGRSLALQAFFQRRFFQRGDASKKAAGSESQRRKIRLAASHWRSSSVLTPPLEEQPGKTELSRPSSFRLSSLLGFSFLYASFSLACTPVSSPVLSSSATQWHVSSSSFSL